MQSVAYGHYTDKKAITPFLPDFAAESILQIDFMQLKQLGIEHIMFDLDQTLRIAWKKKINAEMIEYITSWTNEFASVSLVTNNMGNLRPFASSLNAQIFQPFRRGTQLIRKPHPLFFERALTQLNAKPNTAVMIGDKVRFDVAGANKMGMYSILVKPHGRDFLYDRLLLTRWRERRKLAKAQAALRLAKKLDPPS